MLKVVKHDFPYNPCMLNSSLVNSPMTIGRKTYNRGIATHAESVIEVSLPCAGKIFKADIGRDENWTIMEQAEIVFSIEHDNKKLYSSNVIRGGEDPVSIEVEINGATDFVLHVTGGRWGHADRADARVELENGEEIWLDELPFSGAMGELSKEPPFSFTYDGQNSKDLLEGLTPKVSCEQLDEFRFEYVLTYVLPETNLEIRCESTVYKDYPVAEWVVYFKNNGQTDTAILENIQGLDIVLNRAVGEDELAVNYALGSNHRPNDFEPRQKTLEPETEIGFSSEGGRPSSRWTDGVMPFFNIAGSGGGVITAVGWTGQWAAQLKRNKATGLTVKAGMELTRLKLYPGEQIRTPKIMLLFWKGDRLDGHNMLRNFILDHHSPRPDGRLVQCPICCSGFGTLGAKWHLDAIEFFKDVPYEYHWVDAGWFGDCEKAEQWYANAGSWQVNRRLYPNGLKELSDAARKHGKKFLVWFEPERVYKDSVIYKEHPEWLLGKDAPWREGLGLDKWQDNMLFDLGNTEARQWLTDHISQIISDEQIDLYRQDFNFDPLKFWRSNDEPDRQGATEIHYVEGLYAFWDELLHRHPSLIIDNCASGGRRLDLEMTSRSVPLWRSDLQCSPYYSATGSQAQTYGLAYWLPLNACGSRNLGDTYDFRSALSSSAVVGIGRFKTTANEEEQLWLKQMIEEAIEVRKFHYGNFYPVTEYSLSEEVWFAYQLDRPDIGEGVMMVYRRTKCPYPSATLKFNALDKTAQYSVKYWNTGKNCSLTGKELIEKGLNIDLPNMPDSEIISYRRRRENIS